MNAALKLCQAMYDAQLPPAVSEEPLSPAEKAWIDNAVEQLVRFEGDVEFKRRNRSRQGVTIDDLALAVDEHVNGRAADLKIQTPALGYLLIAAKRGLADKKAADELLGSSKHSYGKLGELAEALLRPFVSDALIAQAEDNEL